MSAQPGWYASPGEPGQARYWDGELWTVLPWPTMRSGRAASAVSAIGGRTGVLRAPAADLSWAP